MAKKRAQAALEFLMTYGWAFIIILIMIAAITYFGVLNPKKILPDRCIFNLAFDCQGYKIGGASGTFDLRLGNNAGQTITVTGIELSVPSKPYTCAAHPQNPSNWKTNEAKDLSWSGCNSDEAGLVSGEKGKVFVKITYYGIDAGPAYSQIAEGEVLSAVS